MSVKDQSGAALAGDFLRRTGLGTYSARETSGSLAERLTRPITKDWYDVVVGVGTCLRCKSQLVNGGNPAGGTYMMCSGPDGWQCYHVGWDEDKGRGHERITREDDDAERT